MARVGVSIEIAQGWGGTRFPAMDERGGGSARSRMAKISVTGLNPRSSTRLAMIVAREPTEPLAALHRAHIASVDGYWKQQDVVFALVVALGIIVRLKFVQGQPQ